jgi:hypothetical protein
MPTRALCINIWQGKTGLSPGTFVWFATWANGMTTGGPCEVAQKKRGFQLLGRCASIPHGFCSASRQGRVCGLPYRLAE